MSRSYQYVKRRIQSHDDRHENNTISCLTDNYKYLDLANKWLVEWVRDDIAILREMEDQYWYKWSPGWTYLIKSRDISTYNPTSLNTIERATQDFKTSLNTIERTIQDFKTSLNTIERTIQDFNTHEQSMKIAMNHYPNARSYEDISEHNEMNDPMIHSVVELEMYDPWKFCIRVDSFI